MKYKRWRKSDEGKDIIYNTSAIKDRSTNSASGYDKIV